MNYKEVTEMKPVGKKGKKFSFRRGILEMSADEAWEFYIAFVSDNAKRAFPFVKSFLVAYEKFNRHELEKDQIL